MTDWSQLIAFMYHEVTDEPWATGFQRSSAMDYKHPVAEFEANLDQIAASGSVPARIDRIDGGGRHLLLTFDDGGKSALVAADLIEKRGWVGHFFIVTGLIGEPGFATRADVSELHDRGHVVGSHSHSHPDVFRRLSEAAMREEWTRSKDILEDILGSPVAAASIPGGHGDHRTELQAAAAGYRFLFTSEPRLIPWRTSGMLCIGRVCPKRGTPLARIGSLAKSRGFARELWLRRAKQAVSICMDVPHAFSAATARREH
jgi:peptidoglycan/xylan/chitin deacetylase (PgdA/CDA1 family)